VQEIAGQLGPLSRQLMECWQRLPKCGVVPDRQRFDPMAIPRVLPVVSVLQRTADGGWRFRVCGSEIERRWRRKITAFNYFDIDILSPRAADAMRREFLRIVEWPCGSWSRRGVEFDSGRRALIETVRLPLRGNDGRIDLIISCSEEVGNWAATSTADAPREIIMITEQQYLDIGAGNPAAGALVDPA
jgi:hypothetical protein